MTAALRKWSRVSARATSAIRRLPTGVLPDGAYTDDQARGVRVGGSCLGRRHRDGDLLRPAHAGRRLRPLPRPPRDHRGAAVGTARRSHAGQRRRRPGAAGRCRPDLPIRRLRRKRLSARRDVGEAPEDRPPLRLTAPAVPGSPGPPEVRRLFPGRLPGGRAHPHRATRGPGRSPDGFDASSSSPRNTGIARRGRAGHGLGGRSGQWHGVGEERGAPRQDRIRAARQIRRSGGIHRRLDTCSRGLGVWI